MPGSMLSVEQYTSDESSAMEEDIRLHPIIYRDCGSICARKLYDVDGFVLIGDDNSLLNIYNKAMQRAFDQRRLRVIRSMKHDYVYFITCESQRQRFVNERQNGCPDLNDRTYYVYRDIN